MMTTRFLRQMAVFGLMAVLTTMAQAQEGGGRPPGGGFGGGRGFGGPGGPGGMFAPRIDRAALLRVEKVRQELKIEEAQAATIDAALAAYNEQRDAAPRPDRDVFQNMSEEERNAYFEKSRKEREELSQKTDDILTALLEEPQAKRLDQIAVQVRMSMSVSAFLKADDIKGKLMVTDEQIAKLDASDMAINEERQKAMQELFPGGFGGPGGGGPGGGGPGGGGPGGGGTDEERQARMTKITEMMASFQKKSMEAGMAVLTDEQKKSVEEMRGAAFEVNMRDFMGGRGGFGGGRGGFGGGRGGQGGGGRGGRPPAE